MNLCKNCGAPIMRVWLSDNYSVLVHVDDDRLINLGADCADGNYADTDQNI